MILASSGWGAIWVAIPLVVVIGIFIVRPFVYRGSSREGLQKLDAIASTQASLHDELTAIRARLDAIDRVLASVD